MTAACKPTSTQIRTPGQCPPVSPGVHRSLGVHNSKVRSCNLVSFNRRSGISSTQQASFIRVLPFPAVRQDTWLPEQVAFVSAMGNARAAAYWEANLPADFRRPPENDMSLLRIFITDK